MTDTIVSTVCMLTMLLVLVLAYVAQQSSTMPECTAEDYPHVVPCTLDSGHIITEIPPHD